MQTIRSPRAGLWFVAAAILSALLGPGRADARLQPRQLTAHTVLNTFPSWAPDNRTLAFASARGTMFHGVTIWTTAADTDTAMQLSYGDWVDEYPKFRPDGKSMLFMSNRTGRFNLYLRDLGMDSTWSVTDPRYMNMFGVWYKDGKRFLYVSVRDSVAGLYEHVVATGAERLIYLSRSPLFYPCLSPDESRIYFSSGESGVTYHLYWVPESGKGRPVVWNDVPGWKMAPVFTPDGRHVLFALSDPKGVFTLWVAPMDSGRAARQIETGLPSGYYPAFSPDGKYLAFCSKDEAQVEDIWIAPWRQEETAGP